MDIFSQKWLTVRLSHHLARQDVLRMEHTLFSERVAR